MMWSAVMCDEANIGASLSLRSVHRQSYSLLGQHGGLIVWPGTRVALSLMEATMFPIGDDRGPSQGAAMVTIALIVLNVLVFVLELGQGSERALQSFITAWGVVPAEYTARHDLPPLIPLPYWSTLITSMFLHGGWMHLGGN